MTRDIGVLVFPGFQLLDAAGPIAVFEVAARDVEHAYKVRTLALEPGSATSSSGVAIVAEAANRRYDTLLVAGGLGSRAASRDERLLGFVRDAATHARRVASVCSGAFVLAAAGLLDGRRATTHWAASDEFARRFPQVRLEPDRIFVEDGGVWTSAGITAGVDLALAMVAEDLGEEAARRAARQLVVYRRRAGGQSQFSALLELEQPAARFGDVLGWARERLAEPLPVERLADRAAMSPRHFARVFTAETGVTPAKAIERLRVEAARERVEGGAESIDRIADRVGFGDPERMRRAFLRAYGQPPQALRRAARA